MILADARGAAALVFWYLTRPRQEAIARRMVTGNVCAIHAAWELYGRAIGLTCRCTPCERAPVVPEVVLRILVQGREFSEQPANERTA